MNIAPRTRANEEPKVSILIVAYNQEMYIAETLEGALAQHYENLEIVVADDGSRDRTHSIIKEFAAAHPGRIVPVLHPVNTGISANCNRGLKACSGELIALFGGDDVMLPGKIEAQVAWFQAHPQGVLCGTLSEDFYDDGKPCLQQPQNSVNASGTGPLNFIRRTRPLSGTTIMIRSSAIPPHGFEERVTMASDHLFFTELLMGGGSYGCVEGLFTKRRIHSFNVSQNQDKIFSDQEMGYRILATRYPEYAAECERAIAEHVYYYQGVAKMRLGENRMAVALFKKAFRLRPLYWKTLVRLMQVHLSRPKLQ
jgi:glycosyltransferase involved in cell wall biosynthesis